jgi:hypothetical protein
MCELIDTSQDKKYRHPEEQNSSLSRKAPVLDVVGLAAIYVKWHLLISGSIVPSQLTPAILPCLRFSST